VENVIKKSYGLMKRYGLKISLVKTLFAPTHICSTVGDLSEPAAAGRSTNDPL